MARVQKSYMVEPTESGIQKEILKNGMVDVTWSLPMQAQHYGSGVLKLAPETALAEKTNEMNSDVVAELTQSSAIIGWGIEKDGTKYWIVRNSFGQQFGENGDIKVLRGQNAFNIESFPGGYEVEMISY